MICSDAHTQSHSCWCKLFEWIRIEWIRTGGIRVEDTYWWDMYWWDTFAIPADAHLLNGYVCNGHVLVGYVWNGYVWNGYVWDMYDVLDMYGILVVIGGIRITTFWMDTHCMDTYWWDTYVWDTFGMDMCGICAMCWICVGYVWWIRLKWICVGYVKCAGYVWDMCGVRYANNLLKNPATKRLSGKNTQLGRKFVKQTSFHHCCRWKSRPFYIACVYGCPTWMCSVRRTYTVVCKFTKKASSCTECLETHSDNASRVTKAIATTCTQSQSLMIIQVGI